MSKVLRVEEKLRHLVVYVQFLRLGTKFNKRTANEMEQLFR